MTGSVFAFRDRIVCAVCNWLLNHVASSHYRAMVGGSVRYGLRSAADGYVPRPIHELLDEDDYAVMAMDEDD